MRDCDIWAFAAGKLADGCDICLVTMVDATGSGPNRPGCRLVVSADGKLAGTVGGGAAEHTLVDAARSALAANPHPAPRTVTMYHRDDAGERGSGMICSGTQVFALLCLTSADLPTVERVARVCRHGPPGRIRLTFAGLAFSPSSPLHDTPSFDADQWCYEETIGIVDTVTLVGGGHVSLALTPLLAGLGMDVVVLDNRPGLPTMENNTSARERRVIDYAQVSDHVPTGKHSYACIMTFGHRHDAQVLEQLVRRPLRYLGMMGSASKIGQIREQLLAAGIPRAALDAVRAPIGLPIASNTPEEIAISIAAEIIAVRNG